MRIIKWCVWVSMLFASGLFLSNFTLNAQDVDEEIVMYTMRAPAEIQRGTSFNVEVIFTIQPNWYIYAPTGTNAALGMIETKVIFALPDGITRAGNISLPKPIRKNGHDIYQGTGVIMSQNLEASALLNPGTYPIKSKITYQTCTSDTCLPPISQEIVTIVNIK